MQNNRTLYPILLAISFVHLLNDSIQSVIPAIFPILKDSMDLSYFQLGLIGFALNFTASLLQPALGLYTDAKPTPGILPLGMLSTFLGTVSLAFAPNYTVVLVSVVLIGIGSAVFHPEGSRVAYMAAGSSRGMAQSIFQVGGNSGQALAPIMTALIFVPLGQMGAIWFTIVAFTAILMQIYVAKWYKQSLINKPEKRVNNKAKQLTTGRKKTIYWAIVILILFIFARYWYLGAISTYYPFFLIGEYGMRLAHAQIYIFVFLTAGVVGTFLGGPLSDRFGRRNLMLFSLLGTAPFALMLPYIGAVWAYPILAIIGSILLSGSSVMIVYAQELIPGKIGTVSGLMMGLAFGLGAIGSAALGGLTDLFGIDAIMKWSALLPLFGFLTLFLPTDKTLRQWAAEDEPV